MSLACVLVRPKVQFFSGPSHGIKINGSGATGKSIAQANDLQVHERHNAKNTVRYGGKHLIYDIREGHLDVLLTTHEARRLATQNTASGNDLRRKAIHDT